ncbi:MAG: hypothetical protein SVV80_14570 [Planctomycetota bacterium]|nr:hypothetical protein [Planctomycetota bacterium]
MIAQTFTVPQFFEAGMLICFGVSWPVSILKSLRTRHVTDKSLGFMVLVFIGYISGLIGKIIIGGQFQAVTILYPLNALFVATDIALYFKYRYNPIRHRLR